MKNHSVMSDFFVTPWTLAHQALLTMISPGKNTGVDGLPFLSLEDLPDPGIKTVFLALQADSSHMSHQGSPFFLYY